MLLTASFEVGVNNSTIIIGPKRTVKSGVKVSGKERSVVDKVAALTSTNVAWVRVPVVVSVVASLLQEKKEKKKKKKKKKKKSFSPGMVSLLGKNQQVQSPNRPLKCLQVVGDA